MTLGLTQPLIEISTINLPGWSGRARPARKADNLVAIVEPNVRRLQDPRHLTTLRAPQPVPGIVVSFSFTTKNEFALFPA
jgi:hypothetical protein